MSPGKRVLRLIPMVAWMLLIFYLSHQPGNVINDTGSGFLGALWHTFLSCHGDKLIHAGVYFVLALTYLFAINLPHKPVLALFMAVAYGLTDEIHQLFVPDRTFDWFDLLANGMGALLGCMLYIRYRRRWKWKIFKYPAGSGT